MSCRVNSARTCRTRSADSIRAERRGAVEYQHRSRMMARDGTPCPAAVDGYVMDQTDTMTIDKTPASAALSVRPASTRRLAALCVAALVTGIGVATWFELRGAVSYAGRLEARTTTATAGRAGRVVSLSVLAGQRVVPGEKLFELADDRLANDILVKKRELVELHQR